jgi:hypothetical protein
MVLRPVPLLRLVPLFVPLLVNAQTLNWTVTQNGSKAQIPIPLSTQEGAGNPSPFGPIKIDTGISSFVFVAPSKGSGQAGNWLRFAPVTANADCTKAPYISYPNSFTAFTPIYLCISGVISTTVNQSRGYYSASLSFTPQTGPSFSLPIQLNVSPSGYLQLLSPKGQTYNDFQFNVGVNNGVSSGGLTVYATLKDSSGNQLTDSQGKPITPNVTASPYDNWVTVSNLSNPNSTTQAFQIGVNPNQLPAGQPTPNSRVTFTNQGSVQGESVVFVDATVTIPAATLTAGVNQISFSFPGGPLSQILNPQSSGALISFNAAAVSDDGTNWLSIGSSTGDTQTPLTVSATVATSKPAGSYTGSVVLTPTNVSAPTVTVPVTLQVNASSYRLAGFITDSSGTCSTGVTLTLSGSSSTSTVAGIGGSYSFGSLPSGQYTITPAKAGCTFNPSSIPVNLTSDSVANNFTGSAAAVTLLFPLNGATGMPVSTSLTWSAFPGATSYDVYFGTGTPGLVASVTSAAWTISGAAPNATYAWRVDAKNGGSILGSSGTWSFTTGVPATGSGLFFVPIPPCHLVDTRANHGTMGGYGPPILNGGETRTFYPAAGSCSGISPTAKAYSFNVTVMPASILQYLTIWPNGQPVPSVSTLNAFEGGTVSNAAIVPAGDGGGVNVFVTDGTHLQLDVNGYFDSFATGSATAFYTVPPCRAADTRNANGTFGGPILSAGATRSFPVASSGCLPSTANPAAYSLNATVVPSGPLGFLELWAANTSQPPSVVTISSPAGAILADAAIVQGSGVGSPVSAYATDQTQLILDVNGYFQAPGGPNALLFHPVTPCRIADTRSPAGPFGGPIMLAATQRTFPVTASGCGIPQGVQAYSVNVTVVPVGVLSFLSLTPTGQGLPSVSTLNDFTGIILANAAIVPAGQNGSIDVYVTHDTHVILDINGYFSFQ